MLATSGCKPRARPARSWASTQQVAKAGERAKGKVEEVTGQAKKKLGSLIKNEQMVVEGKLKEMKGSTRQRVNK